MGEFELIERFFKRPAKAHATGSAVALGIGDDCALLQPSPGTQIAISSDMLVEGRHFFPDMDPAALGHKVLAVNLSDLAAMGAEPLGFTLAIALPPERARDDAWLTAFSGGLLKLADTHGCPLIGGDTTAGPLNLCVTVFGQVPAGQALRRDGAKVGDDIWVSGTLGDARLALGQLRDEWSLPPEVNAAARERLERPSPRVTLGMALRGVASACADVSDGLAGDLGHILKASDVGACIAAESCKQLLGAGEHPSLTERGLSAEALLQIVLAGGDDYELVFTAPANAQDAVRSAARRVETRVTPIGRIEAQQGLRLGDALGRSKPLAPRAFDHFA